MSETQLAWTAAESTVNLPHMDQQDLTDVMHSLRLKALEIEDLVRKVSRARINYRLPDRLPDK